MWAVLCCFVFVWAGLKRAVIFVGCAVLISFCVGSAVLRAVIRVGCAVLLCCCAAVWEVPRRE